jgi:hypothetical protein
MARNMAKAAAKAEAEGVTEIAAEVAAEAAVGAAANKGIVAVAALARGEAGVRIAKAMHRAMISEDP